MRKSLSFLNGRREKRRKKNSERKRKKILLKKNLKEALNIGGKMARTFQRFQEYRVLGHAIESSGYIRPTSIQCNVFSKLRFNEENADNLILYSPAGSGKSLCSVILSIETIKML